MKVKELLEKLADMDPEMDIIVSMDAEGNSYSKLGSVCLGAYIGESSWDIEIYADNRLTEEMKADGYTEEDICEEAERCILLYRV
jgi:hypothetical protein